MSHLEANWWYGACALLDLLILETRGQVDHLEVIYCAHALSITQ